VGYVYFLRLNGANGSHTDPMLLDDQAGGHQLFTDISADGGVLHTLWWDSCNDPCYAPTRPEGNCADRTTVPSLDVYATQSTDNGMTWLSSTRVTDVMPNPNYEQFANRTVPFAGDYLWITSLGDFSYGTWTDWRDTVQGTDPREVNEDEDNTTGAWSSDLCPRDGGLDQNIYGDYTP
jgi:hypothetical protein